MSDSPACSSISRRSVREATIQLLHTEVTHEDELPEAWTLVLAPFKEKITRSRARAILHLQQGRERWTEPLNEQKSVLPPLLDTHVEGAGLARAFRQLLKSEIALSEHFELLRRQLKSSRSIEDIARQLEVIQQENDTTLGSLVTLSENLTPSPDSPPALLLLANTFPPIRSLAQSLRQLFSKQLPERPELSALKTAFVECDELQVATQALWRLVHQNREEADRLIDSALAHYTLDRLAQVDRSILRLAITEMNHCPEIPHAVSINEAIEIARRFSGSDSAGFVNGILDQLKPA